MFNSGGSHRLDKHCSNSLVLVLLSYTGDLALTALKTKTVRRHHSSYKSCSTLDAGTNCDLKRDPESVSEGEMFPVEFCFFVL